MTPLLCACAVVITLEMQKCRKRAPRSVEFNFFIKCDRHKWFLQKERRRADLQNVASDFLIFALLNSISRVRLNCRRRQFCVQLCIETLSKWATSVAHLTNFSFEFFYEIFTEDASLLLLYHGAKKSKMTKNSNQGGSCLNYFNPCRTIGAKLRGRQFMFWNSGKTWTWDCRKWQDIILSR